MSVDTQTALPSSMVEDAAAYADHDQEFATSWAETIGTIVATTVAVLLVSLVAVVMALA